VLQSDYWVKKNHTLLVSGHVAMILFIGNLFSKSEMPLSTLRSNLDYFVPFLLGLLFLLVTSFRGMKLDTYRSLLNLRDGLNNLPDDEKTQTNESPDMVFVRTQISKMSWSIRKLKWITPSTLYASALCLVFGILMLAFGDIVFGV